MKRRKLTPHTKAYGQAGIAGQRGDDGAADRAVGKLGIATTLAAAGSITGMPPETIEAAKAAGCRAFQANGRIDCDALVEFVAGNPELTAGDGVSLQLEKALLTRVNRKLKEQEFDKRAKDLWPIGVCRRAWARNVIACKTKLYASENAASVETQMRLNLTADQTAVLREIITKHLRAAIKEMHVGEWAQVVCPACQKEIAK